MRKITDFIINKRHFILVLFIILTVVCGVLSSKVKINHDIAEYLPDTSETRIGMDIMEEEFSGTETSTLNLMFQDLQDEQKLQIKNELEKIEGVESIDYDDTEKYNKDNYTLYVITVDDKDDSQTATNVYNEITEKYKYYTIYTSGDVSETNKTVLPFGIIVLAVACALVILLIMCESFVEPFLFLTSILMAVVLNKGTNIIFPNVSHITNSIAAILQMALSMDYSIMLMSRYDQEKQTETDKVKAMKNALYKAFQAISSSSVTTIVGLLALVFMSFKIGKDLGFVLAKGVLFSLICIFFVLPALILMFDKWIVKTKKKSPNIKLDWLGKFSYKIRYIAVPLFIIIFITSFLLKGNLGIDYTDTQSDEISNVFTENNQMAIIYKNEDEERISKYLKDFESKEKIDEVLAYGNTINEKLYFDEVNAKLDDLGADKEVEDYLLKIVYYHFYNKENGIKISFEEFVKFIEEEAYNNEKTNEKINDETKANITRLKNFITAQAMNQKKTIDEISNILKIDRSKVEEIFIYYLSKNSNTQMTINEFINFMNKDVLTNEKYAVKVDSNSKNSLSTLSKFTNNETIQSKMTSEQMAEVFGIDASVVNELYKYYISINDINLKLTISEFSNFILEDVLKNSNYANSVDEETLAKLKLLSTVMDSSINNISYTYQEISKVIGIDNATTKNIYVLYIANQNTTSLTPLEFTNFVLSNKDSSLLANSIPDSTIKNLQLLQTVMNGVINNKRYNSSELSALLDTNKENLNLLYGLYNFKYINTNLNLSFKEFVNFLLNDVITNAEYASNFDADQILKLNTVNKIMNDSLNNVRYNQDEIFDIISKLTDNIEKNTVEVLYIYYGSMNQYDSTWQMTLEQFINFLNEDILQDERFTDYIDEDMRNDILDGKTTIADARELLIGDKYSRIVLNTTFAPENAETFEFIENTKNMLAEEFDNFYIIGDSPMAYEMSKTFDNELNSMTVITMISIFIVVLVTFKSFTIPAILVLTIQCAVYLIMGILSL